jgi:hypothetical protein
MKIKTHAKTLSAKWVIEAIIACLDGIQRTTLCEEESR